MKTALKKTTAILLAAAMMFSVLALGVSAEDTGYLPVAHFVAPNTGKDVADALQQLIEDNPNQRCSLPTASTSFPSRSARLPTRDEASP